MIMNSDVKNTQLIANAATLKRVKTPQFITQLASIILLVVVLVVLGVCFIPWQQSVTGTGEVTPFDPANRPQSVESPLDGARIERWLVKEGDWVEKGQPLLKLAEVKTKYLDETQLQRYKGVLTSLEAQQEAAQAQFKALNSQAASVGAGQKAAIASALAKVQQTNNYIASAQQEAIEAKQAKTVADKNLRRLIALEAEGLRSTRDLELAQLEAVRTAAKFQAAQAKVAASQQEQQIAQLEIAKIQADTTAKLQETQAKTAKSTQDVQKTVGDQYKLATELRGLELRQAQLLVKAPVAGRVVRVKSYGMGETVKEGQELLVIVPTTKDQAVELLVSDIDAPLIHVNDVVRLQFAGWPALQFSGWPRAMRGTFAGRVKVVDAVDNGASKFRVLVVPDTQAIANKEEEPWPAPTVLRAGTQSIGWFMLRTVPLGYELWRVFNGFPPALKQKPETYGDAKAPKSMIKSNANKAK
jgi:adhesin transport system membrane fusion protein